MRFQLLLILHHVTELVKLPPKLSNSDPTIRVIQRLEEAGVEGVENGHGQVQASTLIKLIATIKMVLQNRLNNIDGLLTF